MYSYPHFVTRLQTSEVEWLLDVGANVGQFALDIFSNGYSGKIISFEPLKDTHRELSSRAKSNPRWEIAPRCAIGSTRQTAQINIAANSYSSSLRPMLDAHLTAAPESAYIGVETTPVIPLGEFLTHRFVDGIPNFAMKIDTQGYENEVLDGLGPHIDKCVAILIELPLVPLYEGASDLPTMFSRLKELGFRCVGAAPGHHDTKSGDTIEIDGLFIREEVRRKSFEFKIFTSIPPRVDAHQQRRVLDSWRANGFTPVSVNGASEVDKVAKLGLDVEIEVIPTGGKPLIGEILSVIQKSGSAFAGIINADCRMMHYPRLAQSLRASLGGSLLYAQRMETINDVPTMIEFCYGFDGFFFDVSITRGITDARFRMGECWWDYWFPIRLAANGAKMAKLPQPILLHEKHDTNWSDSDWQKYAEVFWQDLKFWHKSLSLPYQVTCRMGRTMMGAESGLIALELYRWLRDQSGAPTPVLLPAEYGDIEKLLKIDNLLIDIHSLPDLMESSQIGKEGKRIGGANAFIRGASRFALEPEMLHARMRRALYILRSDGAGQLARHILRFGRR